MSYANESPRPCPTCGVGANERCRSSRGKPASLHRARYSCPKCDAARVDLKCWHCGWKYPGYARDEGGKR